VGSSASIDDGMDAGLEVALMQRAKLDGEKNTGADLGRAPEDLIFIDETGVNLYALVRSCPVGSTSLW